MPRSFILSCIALQLLFWGQALGQDSIALRYSLHINASALSKHLHTLASDAFEGRETGAKGQHLTSQYIAAHFDSIGIPPLPNGTFLQEYPYETLPPQGVVIKANEKSFHFLKDFYYLPGFQDTVLKLEEIVFLGYGIDDKIYSDFKAKLDLKNKIVLILAGDPEDKKGNSLLTGNTKRSVWSSNWKKKIDYLKTFQPAAIIIAINSVAANISQIRHTVESPTIKKEGGHDKIPYFYVSRELADAILRPARRRMKRLQKEIHKFPAKEHSFAFRSNVELNVVRNAEKIMASNVLGYIEGTDLKEKLVVVSAHLDHLGKVGDKIYYGADDDGSGTSAIMNMAAAFAKAKKEGHGPRRSVLFIAFSGEEKGLLGSDYYTNNPVFPLSNTIANLNIDMIGRVDDKHKEKPEYLYLIGHEKLSANLYKLNESINKNHFRLELDYAFNNPSDPNRFYYRSDHYNFAKNNIPVIFYFNGTHADYHKPTDTVDKINFPLLEKRARFIFLNAWELANRPD